ncbi:MAG: hypothetical protein WAS51_05430 [Ilumatobacteraceae bacterium]|nr:MAG: hypothetical protein IPM43_00315 [Actinomycetota bacterium]
MRRAVAALTTALGLVAPACGGDDSAPATTTTPASSTTAATTSTTAATTSTTTTTSTVLPTSTTTSMEDLEAQISTDFESTWLAYYECIYDPASCDFGAIAVPGSAIDEILRAEMAQRVAEGLRGVRGSGSAELTVESIDLAPDGRVATVVTCQVDGGVLMDIRDPADPTDDVVVNDALSSYRTSWVMRMADERWLRDAVTPIATFRGQDSCAG